MKGGYVSRVWFRWPLSIFKTQLTLQEQEEKQAETPIYLFIDKINEKIIISFRTGNILGNIKLVFFF